MITDWLFSVLTQKMNRDEELERGNSPIINDCLRTGMHNSSPMAGQKNINIFTNTKDVYVKETS